VACAQAIAAIPLPHGAADMIRAVLVAATVITGATMANADDTSFTVVEIVTFDFAEGLTTETFVLVDAHGRCDTN